MWAVFPFKKIKKHVVEDVPRDFPFKYLFSHVFVYN